MSGHVRLERLPPGQEPREAESCRVPPRLTENQLRPSAAARRGWAERVVAPSSRRVTRRAERGRGSAGAAGARGRPAVPRGAPGGLPRLPSGAQPVRGAHAERDRGWSAPPPRHQKAVPLRGARPRDSLLLRAGSQAGSGRSAAGGGGVSRSRAVPGRGGWLQKGRSPVCSPAAFAELRVNDEASRRAEGWGSRPGRSPWAAETRGAGGGAGALSGLCWVTFSRGWGRDRPDLEPGPGNLSPAGHRARLHPGQSRALDPLVPAPGRPSPCGWPEVWGPWERRPDPPLPGGAPTAGALSTFAGKKAAAAARGEWLRSRISTAASRAGWKPAPGSRESSFPSGNRGSDSGVLGVFVLRVAY